jgi:uncharacterized protein
LRKIALLILTIILIISALSTTQLHKIKLSYDLEKFFPSEDNDLQYYNYFREQFGSDNNFLLIAIENPTGIFDSVFLSKINELQNKISQIKHIKSAQSIINIKFPIVSPLGNVTEINYLNTRYPEKYPTDSIRIFNSPHITGNFIAKDAQSICLVIQTAENLSKIKSDSLLYNIHHTLSNYSFHNVHLGGRIVSQEYIINKMNEELIKFMSISFFVLIIVLFLIYRSFYGVVIPVIIVIISTLFLLVFLIYINQPLNLITIILPTVIFVVGTSDVIHFITRYTKELKETNYNVLLSLKTTFKEVGIATFLTSLTTAIGFLTLISSSVEPLREFGWITALGVLFTFIITFIMLPPILILIGNRWKQDVFKEKLHFYSFFYQKIFLTTLKHAPKVVWMFVFITIIGLAGMNRLKINTFLLDDLKNTDKHKQSFMFFEQHYDGIRPLEIALEIKEGFSFHDIEVMTEIQKIETFIQNQFNINNISSPITFIKSINQSLNNGNVSYYQIPNEDELPKVVSYLKRIKHKDYYKSFVNENVQLGRMSGRIMDKGSFVLSESFESFNEFISTTINQNILSAKIVGSAHLIDKNAVLLAQNMWIGLSIAFIVVAFITALLFKSLRMVFIALIPNIFPLIMTAGVMGFFGIDLKPSTIIIFTISFGIAVDDTIHFITKFRAEINKNRSFLNSLKNTYLASGKAIIITSIILCAGFSSLIFSTFQSTYYIGLLISMTLGFALLADLILLPTLLHLFYRKTT